MTPTKYHPATLQNRQAIETQDLLDQAAFWSREYQLNPADLEAQMAIKDIFDPAWLLNAAKVFPLDTSDTRRAA